MTTIGTAILGRLQALGFEVEPDPPAVVVRYRHAPEPPPEALAALDELKAHKDEVLEALTAPTRDASRWDDDWERVRLASTFDWCDAEPRGHGVRWTDVWRWASTTRPDLRRRMDEALDGIDSSWKAQNVPAHIAACNALRGVVQVTALAYRDVRYPAGVPAPSKTNPPPEGVYGRHHEKEDHHDEAEPH